MTQYLISQMEDTFLYYAFCHKPKRKIMSLCLR